MSARFTLGNMLLASLLAAAGCGSRSALDETAVHEGGTFLDVQIADVRTDPRPRDASMDVADRSIDAREEQPSDVPEAGPPIDACVPSCAGRACGAIDGCGGTCAVGPCPDGLHCAAGACVCDPLSCPLGECVTGQCQMPSAITLFGGADASGYVGDTWTWDGNAWLKHDVPGPSPRYGPSMALLGGKNVLFGGAGYVDGMFTASDQTYEWDGASWTLRNVIGPPRRWVHTMAALNGKIVVFGGFDGTQYLGDTWEWDGMAWIERMVQGPPNRARHAMTTFKEKVLLFGGQNDSDTFNDTWEWDGSAWTQRDVSSAPEPRVGHAMGALADKAIMTSGGHLGRYFVDTWEWDGSAWTELAVQGPSPRAVPAMATLQGKIVLFGGVVNVGGPRFEYLADTWEWDGTTWTERKASGPIGVSDAAMSAR